MYNHDLETDEVFVQLNKIKKIHIIGIGGCAASAIAEFLNKNNITVTGSEIKRRDGLEYLENKNIKVAYEHNKKNLHLGGIIPDIVLYSPAVISLNPNNPELIESKRLGIKTISWEEFIGEYLNALGSTGITVSGSEGKGTTAGILTMILKGTELDPLAILGAKIKNVDNGIDSNIYMGKAKTYILEGDEYNRNFFNYHPTINITVNFQFEHPETYKDFNDYKNAFNKFFSGMKASKTLIFKNTKNLIDFAKEYNLDKTHKIIWYGDSDLKIDDCHYLITNQSVSIKGVSFKLKTNNGEFEFVIPSLPGYLVYNAAGAVIAAIELGLPVKTIQQNIQRFKGMVRRFDIYKTKNNGIIITDYGHSPESIRTIVGEIRNIFKDKKLHLVFQPHLFSRTYNFFNEFIEELGKADRISLIDIYPAREKIEDWDKKINSFMIYENLKKNGCNVFYAGKSSNIPESLKDKINDNEITCFIGAGDMDIYYPVILHQHGVTSYF
jgi:UDP-N-acetylmuramate--alanine ligase